MWCAIVPCLEYQECRIFLRRGEPSRRIRYRGCVHLYLPHHHYDSTSTITPLVLDKLHRAVLSALDMDQQQEQSLGSTYIGQV